MNTTKPKSASMSSPLYVEEERRANSAGKSRFPPIHKNTEVAKSYQIGSKTMSSLEKNHTSSPTKMFGSTLNNTNNATRKPPLLLAKPMLPPQKIDPQDTSAIDSLLEVPFEKVLKLMSDRHSSDQYDRHEAALKKLMKSRKEGFVRLNLSKLLTNLSTWMRLSKF
jgi:hypothetical protein